MAHIMEKETAWTRHVERALDVTFYIYFWYVIDGSLC